MHVDTHADTNDAMFGERITNGTMFRRAIEEQHRVTGGESGVLDVVCLAGVFV